MNERSSSASALRLTAEAGSWERGDPIARHGLGPGLRRADMEEAFQPLVVDRIVANAVLIVSERTTVRRSRSAPAAKSG